MTSIARAHNAGAALDQTILAPETVIPRNVPTTDEISAHVRYLAGY